MRGRWSIMAGIVLAFVMMGLLAPAASATDPVPLDPGVHITDVSDVLTPAQESAAEARLRQLSADTGVDLFFVFVPEFTNPTTDTGWVSATADQAGLSPRQYLIGVATQTRVFASNGQDGGTLSASDRQKITDAMIPALKQSDWAGSIDAAAAEVHDIVIDAPARAARSGAIIGGVVVVAVIGVVVFFVIRSARKRAAERTRIAAQIAELSQQAGIALVGTDDLVRSSEQEMDYARAQFGDDIIGEFVAALTTSRTNLDQAFALKQKLDDEIPDTDQEKISWNEQILQLCSLSTQRLKDLKAGFDELRELEQNAPAALENVRRLRAAAGEEITRADGIFAALSAIYDRSSLSAVADNTTQARSRMSFTDEQIQVAEEHIAAGSTGDAAVAIRAAEGAVQQATQLEDAVEKLQNDLRKADERSAALVAEVQADLQAALRLPDPQGAVAQAVAATRERLDLAREQLGPSGRRPVEALAALETANSIIDRAVQQARSEQERIARARTMLASALARADAQVSAAENFILTRRGAVGSVARTRLTEAQSQRAAARAIADADPAQALALAQNAVRLADEALRAAQYDVNGWGGGSSGGGDTLGALLGGILIGQASGRRGSSWGGGGGFGGGFSGGGGFSSGGFGGGRSSSSGGRF